MTYALDTSGQLKLIIFDCDGVLVDSERASCQATAQFARSLGFEITDDEAHDRFVGKALPQIVKEMEYELGYALPKNTALEMRDNLVHLMQKVAEPIEGALKMLRDIRDLRVPFRVGSNSSKKEMAIKFEKTGMSHFFLENRIHSATEMGKPKPEPDVFLYAAEREGVLPENCVVVEDSDTGAEAVRKAGMSCVLLRPKTQALPDFWPISGSVRIENLSQLAPLLRKVIERQNTND